MRFKATVAGLVATLIVVNLMLATAALGWLPTRYYSHSTTSYLYKAAPATLCNKLLAIDGSRRTNSIGCRYRAAIRTEFFTDAISGWTWRDHTITFAGPFGFYSASSEVTDHFNGTTVTVDAQRCLQSAAFVKVDVTSCRNWKQNGNLLHEVDFKVTYDSIPLLNLSYTYWAQQTVSPHGNAIFNIFGP